PPQWTAALPRARRSSVKASPDTPFPRYKKISRPKGREIAVPPFLNDSRRHAAPSPSDRANGRTRCSLLGKSFQETAPERTSNRRFPGDALSRDISSLWGRAAYSSPSSPGRKG